MSRAIHAPEDLDAARTRGASTADDMARHGWDYEPGGPYYDRTCEACCAYHAAWMAGFRERRAAVPS